MPETRIHPTAIVESGAELGQGVVIGPYCHLSARVSLGDGCVLKSHVVIDGPARIGRRNRFYSHSVIGEQTQDLKYAGEPTRLRIGDDNTFREFVTVHRSTARDGATRIGSHNHFLAYCHIAHDCVVGDRVIFSNNSTLAGHVAVADGAILGGFTAIHQFCRIGSLAMTGGCTKITHDVPPAMLADGNPARIRGYNKIGLERNGWSEEQIQCVREAYKILYLREMDEDGRRAALAELSSPWARQLLDFLDRCQRGMTPRGESGQG